MSNTSWDQRYVERNTPWDSGLRSRELASILEEIPIAPCRAAELGCGSGTNAVFLAQAGFDVTALDFSAAALAEAQDKAQAAGVPVCFVEADLCQLSHDLGTFDFVFDRGCYHCARKIDLAGYQETLRRMTHAGSHYLCLTGNANEPGDAGPPRVTPEEIRAEWSGLFEIVQLREFHFQDAGGVEGPLGWSCLMMRR